MTIKAEIPYELLERLPKTDLHCHLDGSLRLDTVVDLARRHQVALPTEDRGGLHRMLTAGERVASELAEDAHRENVRYIEVRYSPVLHTRDGLRPAQVVEAVLRGLRAA